jgi:hypothetical protein
MAAFIHTMHTSRTYMPPFPGNDREAEALIAYLNKLRDNRELILDAHAAWVGRSLTESPSPSGDDKGAP